MELVRTDLSVKEAIRWIGVETCKCLMGIIAYSFESDERKKNKGETRIELVTY